MTRWLGLCCFTVIALIVVGGFTRLSNSGLSIVEWKPVAGILPPLNQADWEKEFEKYKTSPEFSKINNNMNLAAFKKIFWPEFIHRILGRSIGLLYFLPLIYFYLKGKVKKRDGPTYVFIAFLICLQGFLGWYMVKSGLVAVPFVSHFRLALHLTMAVIIYSLLLIRFMDNYCDILIIDREVNLSAYKSLSLLSLGALYVQIFLGALVSGLDAGLIYGEFPLMGGSLVPKGLSLNFYDPVFVQFIHRLWAYTVAIILSYTSVKLLGLNHPKIRKLSLYIFLALCLQIALGIATLLYSVPLTLALLHQLGAVLLVSVVLRLYLLLRSSG